MCLLGIGCVRGDPVDDGVRYARNGDVVLAYETFGDPTTGVPLLLIMGLDFQMLWWPEGFCQALAERGFAVARFDNRDTGLSTHLPAPDRARPWQALVGRTEAAYTGQDMVADALAVMDDLGWEAAAVLGVSMGAALAQGMALLHPGRVNALICISGGGPVDAHPVRALRWVRWGTIARFARLPSPRDDDEAVEALVALHRGFSSPTLPYPEQGHDLPERLWPDLVERIERVAGR